jgi:hypothetical protein
LAKAIRRKQSVFVAFCHSKVGGQPMQTDRGFDCPCSIFGIR